MPTQIGPYTQSDEAKAKFDDRMGRYMSCINLQQPDRMLIAHQSFFFAAEYSGISYKDYMYDYEKNKRAALKVLNDFDIDIASNLTGVSGWGPTLEAAGFKQLEWPGGSIGDMQPYQYVDREYMSAEEYDDFLFDPTGFYLHKYLPRIADCFDGLDLLPNFAGNHYIDLIMNMQGILDPKFQSSIDQIKATAQESINFVHHATDLAQQTIAQGHPIGFGAIGLSPYDFIADFLRGATGMMKDLFRHKEKLKLALEKACVMLSRETIKKAKRIGHPVIFIPIHWAPDAFMSQKQFIEFWWPTFRQYMLNLIDAGFIPLVMWEADCTKRLEVIKDIPEGKCVYWFERTDMVKAFEALGDRVALRGNISPSLLTTGKPDEVDAAVKHLVDNVWNRGGNLILDGAFGIPDETPAENLHAMYNAARKYAG